MERCPFSKAQAPGGCCCLPRCVAASARGRQYRMAIKHCVCSNASNRFSNACAWLFVFSSNGDAPPSCWYMWRATGARRADMKYQLPAFLPDQLPRGDVLTRAENVYPARNGYRAAQGFISVSDALPATFRGGSSFIASNGTASLLVGTSNGLVKLSGGSWTDLLVALSIGGRWRVAQFGDFAVCVNGVTTYQVDLVASTASQVSKCLS